MTPDPSLSRWSRARAVTLLAFVFALYAYLCGTLPGFSVGNEALPVQQALAIYTEHRFSVEHQMEVNRFGFNDIIPSKLGGRYPDKGLGGTLCMLWPAPIVDALTPGPLTFRALSYGGRVLALSLPFVLFLYFLGRRLEKLVRPDEAWCLILAYALASNASIYSTVFFTHNLAAIFITSSLFLLWRKEPLFFAAGLLAGTGVLIENTVFLAVPVLAALALRSGRKPAAAFLLGVAPPIGIQLVYQWACFGSPWIFPQSVFHQDVLGSHYSFNRPGFGAPAPRALLGLLAGPSRGLFFHSPWLLLAPAAVLLMKKIDAGVRPYVVTALVCFTAHLLLISGYKYWDGAWSVGPRYLTAFLPMLVLAAAAALSAASGKLRKALFVFLAAGMSLAAIEHLLYLASVPYHPNTNFAIATNFVRDLAWPFLSRGYSVYTVANFFGASVGVSRVILGMIWLACFAVYAIGLAKDSRDRLRLWAAGVTLGVLLFAGWVRIGNTDPVRFESDMKKVINRNGYRGPGFSGSNLPQ